MRSDYALVRISKGYWCAVDFRDYDRVAAHRWTAIQPNKLSPTVYAMRADRSSGRKRTVYMHRELLSAPKGAEVDHRNHDGLNNRRSNLRVCDHSQQMSNRRTQRAGTVSGYKGVRYSKLGRTGTPRTKPFQACVHGRPAVSLGMYATAEEAARAYNAGASIVYGDFAQLNDIVPRFPDAKSFAAIRARVAKRLGVGLERGVA